MGGAPSRHDRHPAAARRRQRQERLPPTLPLLTPHLSDELFAEPPVALPAMPLCEQVVEDYVATGLSLKAHPVRFFRDRLAALGAIRNAALRGERLLTAETQPSPSPDSFWCGSGRAPRRASCS